MVGLGGAGFPTHVKLSPPPTKTIYTVIMNAAEWVGDRGEDASSAWN